ncbi:MAG: hypothetical protein IT447_01080 [Phycisphaerales bacterium]|jgi:hypothetical protein|nr:hypothetical protein [Phycisphaerales bacterium]
MDQRKSTKGTWIFLVLLLLSIGLCVVGYWLANSHGQWALLAGGCLSVIFTLAAWAITSVLANGRTAVQQRNQELLVGLGEQMRHLGEILNQICEQQLISDRAKSVAFRSREREAVRRAIEEDITAGDWDAANALAVEMETVFGYRQESVRLRDEIAQKRQDILRREVAEVSTLIDGYMRSEQWSAAQKEAEKLAQSYPNDQMVKKLPQEIESRRQAFKKQLLDQWHESVHRRDIDGSIGILKKLDTYLSPAEAESMQESVRGVFKAKLDNMRVQFSAAVQDHHWAEAIRVGDAIMRDFPNAKIAQEVREKMAALRERANVEATQPAGV